MMKEYPYLNDEESLAIEMLTEGKRLKDIREAVSKTIPKHYFYAFLAALRLKTGIKDLQSVTECLAYRSAMEQTAPTPELTSREVKLLEHLIASRPVMIVAGMLAITESEAQEQTEAALLKCGILTRHPRTRRTQARMYFARHGNPNNFKPEPSTTHLKILRNLASGRVPEYGTALTSINAKVMAKEACDRINATCPGRNAQRKLIQTYLAKRDARDLMNDPMF